MVSRERINLAKTKLGNNAFFIMAKEIPLEDVNESKLSCKSPFKEEKTASAFWFNEGNMIKDFSTGLTMDFIDFSMKYHNKSFFGAVKELFDLVGFTYNDGDFKEDFNEDIYKTFKKAKDETSEDRTTAEKYLLKRGITAPTLDYCNVKQDASGNIAYQFFDHDNQLIQTKYRVSHSAKNGEFKWFWQKGADNCPLLYGINKVNYSVPLLIVEGMNDRLACVEAGYLNCVSIPGGANDKKWIEFNFDILEKFDEIILWFDDDQVGSLAAKECANRLGIYKTKIVSSDQYVKNKIKEYYSKYGTDIDKMDANNVLVCAGKDYVINLISKAEAVKNEHLKRLFDYEEVELQNMPYCSTGFKSLDKIIYGNFEGTFIVLTGYSGAGKSTLISEMGIIAPLESNKKVMIYSGEASGGVLLGNTFRPLAGRDHIIEYDNSSQGKPNGYAVTFAAKDAIREYYRDLIYNYDDGDGLSCNAKDILDGMEYAYRRYDVKFFTLDNLMTITTSDSDDDKYSSQIKFAKSLKAFTRKYPVTVILVAHPKKPAPGQREVDMYSVSGSSEIINLADRAFSVSILHEDKDGYDSCITVLKDRQTGKVNKKIKMFFDLPSGRIYSDKEELNKHYSWEIGFKPSYNESVLSKLVNNVHKDKTIEVFGEIKK